jgi:hypothetical protein
MSTGYQKQMNEDDEDDRKAPTDEKSFANVTVNDNGDEGDQHPLVWIPKKLVTNRSGRTKMASGALPHHSAHWRGCYQ